MITTTAPTLPEDLESVLRGLRLPYIRRAAPEVLATAKAQRWEPAEVLRPLLTEERHGRDRSAVAIRRAAAGFPSGKTFAVWREADSSIPAPTLAALRESLGALVRRHRVDDTVTGVLEVATGPHRGATARTMARV